MGSRLGYEYRYRFSMVDVNEINSRLALYQPSEGAKLVIFEVRTDFVISRRRRSEDEGEGVADLIIDSERYDTGRIQLPDEDARSLCFNMAFRLMEYWMTKDEVELLCNEAIAFARHKAADTCIDVFGLIVNLEVCTVQQEGESLDATEDRAIVVKKLFPLYLSNVQTVVERKPMTDGLRSFLREIRRIRVENTDKGWNLMPVCCCICLRKAYVADQVSVLPCCCAFHSSCIIRHLEGDNLCPKCRYPAYDRRIAEDEWEYFRSEANLESLRRLHLRMV